MVVRGRKTAAHGEEGEGGAQREEDALVFKAQCRRRERSLAETGGGVEAGGGGGNGKLRAYQEMPSGVTVTARRRRGP